MRLAIAQASSIERVWISAPRPTSDARITSRRGCPGSSRAIAAATASRYAASGDSTMLCANSSCSAWLKRSIATQSGSVLPSASTRISLGPAIMSIPTVPNTRRLALAT
ncbi:MAG: hypothetical protein LKCHEGNO_03470 [Burkholderiaceae bacterium]|nr:hypothetical protein [Burkholderiaceae bacterium]